MNAVAEKFSEFEWLTQGITAQSPKLSDEPKGTGEKPLDYQDRLGAIASMETQLEKSITSVIVFGEKSKGDFDYIQNHLARILISNAKADKRKEPEFISIEDLAERIAFMVLQFALDPEYEDNFTAKGRLHAAGLRSYEMSVDQYRKTWRQYENMMVIALETSIKCASETVAKYRKKTQKEFQA